MRRLRDPDSLRWLLLVLLALFAAQASSQVSVTVKGDEARAQINLLGIGAEFSLVFDQPENLSVQSLGLGARLINPLDPALRARLPDSRLGVPLALPLLITVNPPAARGLAFSNVVDVELHTHLLPYSIASPLRIYKARPGGPFHDITSDVLPGSVRTRGRTGGFSEFLVLVDLIPLPESAAHKYDILDESVLAVVHPALRAQLQADLAASRSAWTGGDLPAARSALDLFEKRVRSEAGVGIPNRWRAQRDLDNVAGDLLTEAGALRYVLVRLGG
jgi:hypothetical protein